MTERRFYIGIENLGLNDSQRATLVEELKRLGRQDYPNPCLNNHWTTRPDNQAVIFEALFEEELWTIEQDQAAPGDDLWYQRLADYP
jgi:hypothetical protein